MEDKLEYMGLIDCLKQALIETLSHVFSVEENVIARYFNELKLKIVKTPDPSLGDYGIALHSIFHSQGIGRGEWSVYAERIIGYLRDNGFLDKCYVRDTRFVNGYLNFFIDYNRLFKRLVEEFSTRIFFEKIKGFGGGSKVLVEHTSANPIHPLHIGSGRNAVIGNTFARLLRYLGFNVREHFYVNDMGRQVAILVYGYSLLKKHGVKPDPGVKVDHWFGAVYAITNTLIEKQRLRDKLHSLEKEFREYLSELRPRISGLVEEYKLYVLLDLLITLDRVLEEQCLRHDTLVLMKSLLKKLDSVVKDLGEQYSGLRDELTRYRGRVEEFLNEYREAFEELNEYSGAESRLASQYPLIHDLLSREIVDYREAEERINEYMRRYEDGDEEVSRLFREVSMSVLEGFKETLSKLGILFDSFDWESGDPGRKYLLDVIEKIEDSPYGVRDGGALIVDLERASRDHVFIRELFEPDSPGRFVLRRSDGTTLYTVRDVAYSIYKVRDLGVDRVYNVIAVEQVREQKQVKATLYLSGYRDVVDKLVHFVYEMVNLKGMKMSSRRGQYYSLDELFRDYMDVIAHKYFENQLKLGRIEYGEDTGELLDKFMKLGIACTRALLLSVEPGKVLVFDPRRIEEYDLGAWITYTFVRLQSILRKAYNVEPLDNIEFYIEKLNEIQKQLREVDIELNSEEKNILETLNDYHYMLLKAYNELDPSKILEYTRNLCIYLNKLYETHPILGEKNPIKRSVRIALVIASVMLLKDLLWIMGFPLIKKL